MVIVVVVVVELVMAAVVIVITLVIGIHRLSHIDGSSGDDSTSNGISNASSNDYSKVSAILTSDWTLSTPDTNVAMAARIQQITLM